MAEETAVEKQRVKMLRSIGKRPDLLEGKVCEVTAEEAADFIAAKLAEPVAEEKAKPAKK